MLVLTRKIDKAITIDVGGERCEIKVLDILDTEGPKKGQKVKLGFTAPQSVKIYRNELLQKGNDAKAASPGDDSGKAVGDSGVTGS